MVVQAQRETTEGVYNRACITGKAAGTAKWTTMRRPFGRPFLSKKALILQAGTTRRPYLSQYTIHTHYIGPRRSGEENWGDMVVWSSTKNGTRPYEQ